jgi:hypothetical protein
MIILYDFTVVAVVDQVPTPELWNVERGNVGYLDDPSPLSRSSFLRFFLGEVNDRKVFWRWSVTMSGCCGSTIGVTLVKYTQSHQVKMVKMVRGTAMAASNQALAETFMEPLLVCTNWVEKKF